MEAWFSLPFASWIPTSNSRDRSSSSSLTYESQGLLVRKTAFRPISARGEVSSRGRDIVHSRPATRARSADSLDSHDLPRARRKPRSAAQSNKISIASAMPTKGNGSKSRGTMSREHKVALATKVESMPVLPYWYRLGSQMLIGRKPRSLKELQMLKNQKVTAIVSVVLPHEHEVSPEQVRCMGFSHLEIGVKEGEPLTLSQVLEGIRFLRLITMERLGTVYVHCRAGRVRCVMLCVAFVMAMQGLDPAEAEEQVLSKVPGGKLRTKHKEVLANLNKMLRRSQKGVKGFSFDTK